MTGEKGLLEYQGHAFLAWHSSRRMVVYGTFTK
jgi:hypothetical protein